MRCGALGSLDVGALGRLFWGNELWGTPHSGVHAKQLLLCKHFGMGGKYSRRGTYYWDSDLHALPNFFRCLIEKISAQEI